MRIVVCFGTRPEVIKLAPVVAALRRRLANSDVMVLSTEQQPALLRQTLPVFGLSPDIRLAADGFGPSLSDSLAFVVRAVSERLRALAPALVVVQGDTLSTYGSALAAFYEGIPVVHVEAGLRTFDLREPFPEELHRQAIGRIASLHLAPTDRARDNLLAEGIHAESVAVTGNTGQDALLSILERCAAPELEGLNPREPYAVLTVHRRENLPSVSSIAEGVRRGAVASALPVVVVLHPNPAASKPLREALAGCERVVFSPPLAMEQMVGLCRAARFLVTDSGGLQEEATALGVPCVVLRARTDRPESVDCGNAAVIGTESSAIAGWIERLADDEELRRKMTVATDVYGDGHAAERCADAIEAAFL